MHSSQNEQDNRSLAWFSRCPLLEPADSQEAFDMARAAFDLSEKRQVPVILRITTRVAHTSTVVDLPDTPRPAPAPIPYARNPRRNVSIPAFAREMRYRVEDRTAALRADSEASSFNRPEPGAGDTGFVASGVAYQYVREVFPDAPVFKVGFSYPLPLAKIAAWAAPRARLVCGAASGPVMADRLLAAGLPSTPPNSNSA
jgi:indolepyruvate ferredoxin oxidoreductase alpha subunit